MTTQQLIKWPGGKRQLLPEILRRLPASWGTYHEPFLGGASVFLELARSGWLRGGVIVSDVNADLVNLYKQVRDHPDHVIATVKLHASEISETEYYAVRRLFNEDRGAPPHLRAAWFLYLNHLAFNGLWRVNGKNEMNVAYCHPEKYGGGGSRKHTAEEIVREDTIRECSKLFRDVEIRHVDFRDALQWTRAGDLIYLDPPYWPRDTTANFTAYAGTFGSDDQRALADRCREMDRQGVMWLASNSDMPAVREMYRGFRIETVMARRSINRDASKRGPVAELLISNYDPTETIAPAPTEKFATRVKSNQLVLF